MNFRPEMPREVRKAGAEVLRGERSSAARAALGRVRPAGRGGEGRTLLGQLWAPRMERVRWCLPSGQGVGGFQADPWGESWGVHLSTTSAGWGETTTVSGSAGEPQRFGAPRKGFLQGRGSAGAGRGCCAFLPLKKKHSVYLSSPSPTRLQTSLLKTDILHLRLTAECLNLVTI